MYCPMLKCPWEVSDLISTEANSEPTRPQDELITQFSLLVEHLQEEHDAVVGGLMPDGTYPPPHPRAGQKPGE